MECTFCNIANHKIPTDALYEDDEVMVFHDINPKAKKHILVIPKKHIESVQKMEEKDSAVVGKLLWVAKNVAEKEGIAESGFKLVINSGKDAGQLVPHLHIHVLGGEPVQGIT